MKDNFYFKFFLKSHKLISMTEIYVTSFRMIEGNFNNNLHILMRLRTFKMFHLLPLVYRQENYQFFYVCVLERGLGIRAKKKDCRNHNKKKVHETGNDNPLCVRSWAQLLLFWTVRKKKLYNSNVSPMYIYATYFSFFGHFIQFYRVILDRRQP